MKVHDLSGLVKGLGKNKYILLAAGLALVLMLLPGGNSSSKAVSGQGSALESSGIPMDTESARISDWYPAASIRCLRRRGGKRRAIEGDKRGFGLYGSGLRQDNRDQNEMIKGEALF